MIKEKVCEGIPAPEINPETFLAFPSSKYEVVICVVIRNLREQKSRCVYRVCSNIRHIYILNTTWAWHFIYIWKE